jgi:hypothetical protein
MDCIIRHSRCASLQQLSEWIYPLGSRHSNRYEQIHWFGDLFDDVLRQLSVGDSTPSDPKRRYLAELLISVAS